MRKTFAAALISLAWLLVAAKPTEPVRSVTEQARTIEEQARRAIYRGQGLAVCLPYLNAEPGAPAAPGQVCTCALDRFTASRPADALPVLDDSNIQRLLGADLAACSGGAATASDAKPAISATPPATPDALPTPPAAADTDAAKDGESWFSGLSNFSLPSLGGMPDWAWWALGGLLIIFFFARRVLRGEVRDNLDGPPRSMKPSAPVQPRHPNLPPRG